MVIGFLWQTSVRHYQNALPYQPWTSEEPPEPRDSLGFVPEPRTRLLGDIGDFTAYDYMASRSVLDAGESHVQCHICHRWSVFPLLHIDGPKYMERELGIHRAMCHPNLAKEREKFRIDYVGPFEKRYEDASRDALVAWGVMLALPEGTPEATKAEQAHDEAERVERQAYDAWRAALGACFRALDEGLKEVPQTYFDKELQDIRSKRDTIDTPSR